MRLLGLQFANVSRFFHDAGDEIDDARRFGTLTKLCDQFSETLEFA